jgi:hypothetical protein
VNPLSEMVLLLNLIAPARNYRPIVESFYYDGWSVIALAIIATRIEAVSIMN